MLRRRPDDRFELLLVEEALSALAPPPLSQERREALRQRIMDGLGLQEPAASWGIRPGERWVLIPAGIGIVAAILAAAKIVDQPEGRPDRSTPYRAQSTSTVSPIDSLPSTRWISFGREVAVGAEAGTTIESIGSAENVVLRFYGGRATVATAASGLSVTGNGFIATMPTNSVAIFETSGDVTVVTAMFGRVVLALSDGTSVDLSDGMSHTVGAAPSAPVSSSAAPAGPGPSLRPTVEDSPAPVTNANPPGVASAPRAVVPAPAEDGVSTASTPPTSKAASATEQPDVSVEAPVIPAPAILPVMESPGSVDATGGEGSAVAPEAESASPGDGDDGSSSNAGGNGNGNANSNAGGNGNGNANSNAGGNGNGNGNANSNAGGNGNGNANSSASGAGNGNGNANSNAGGNGNGNANSNASGAGNGNGNANSNAGGNGNGNANSNAGGNGNGNSNANSNAGGNGNGNGNTNSNAGGNGNGNGNANSNAGGNGNGNGNSDDAKAKGPKK